MDKISGSVQTKEKYEFIVKDSTTKYMMFGRKLISDNMKYFIESEMDVLQEDAAIRGIDVDFDKVKDCLHLDRVIYRSEKESSDSRPAGAVMDLYFKTTKKCAIQYQSEYPITLGFDMDNSLNPHPYLIFGIMNDDLI